MLKRLVWVLILLAASYRPCYPAEPTPDGWAAIEDAIHADDEAEWAQSDAEAGDLAPLEAEIAANPSKGD